MSWDMLATILATLGGLEFVKFLFNRKTNGRIEEAKADTAELEVFIKRIDALSEQIAQRDKQAEEDATRYREQTERLRKTQDELLESIKTIGELKLAFRQAHLWECQLGSCRKRVPANPILWDL
jgi:hypothetical protein